MFLAGKGAFPLKPVGHPGDGLWHGALCPPQGLHGCTGMLRPPQGTPLVIVPLPCHLAGFWWDMDSGPEEGRVDRHVCVAVSPAVPAVPTVLG